MISTSRHQQQQKVIRCALHPTSRPHPGGTLHPTSSRPTIQPHHVPPPSWPNQSLEGLPQELVVRIASFLSTAELGPLRRSCRNIERQLFDTFAHEFFTKRKFMLEHESLAALVGISRHPGLASRLSEVIISTHVLALSERLLRQRLESGHVEREVLLCTGLARDMLVEAFSNLPNLAKVGLRDYDGAGRIRDGATARWRSWGWSLGLAARDDVPHAMLPLLLAALGQAQARPSNVEVFLRHRHLDFNSFRPTSGLPGAAVTAVLADLKTLMLAVSARSSGSQDSHDSLTPWASYEDENLVELPLRTFLHDTPKLKSLRLNFEREISWATSPFSTPTVRLPALKVLDLGYTNAAAAGIVRVLTKFDLESFSLWKVTLQSPGPSSETCDCWADLLLQLSMNLPVTCRIRKILIGWGTQYHFTKELSTPLAHLAHLAQDVRFAPRSTPAADKWKAQGEATITFEAQYTGMTVHDWLREMSEATLISGIHTPPLNVGMLFGSDADENFESAEEDSELNDDDEDDSMDDGEGEGEVGEEDVGGAGGRSSAL